MEKVFRVFYHELGHFVARELNSKYFDGPLPVAIQIFPCRENIHEYCGEISFGVSGLDRGRGVPKERLAIYLAATTYGCMFQAYFQKVPLKHAQDRNGQDDLSDWAGALVAHKVDNMSISSIEDKYFNCLTEINGLDGFFSIVPNEFLIPEGKSRYSVALERLRTVLGPAIVFHYNSYQMFIDDLNTEILANSNS